MSRPLREDVEVAEPTTGDPARRRRAGGAAIIARLADELLPVLIARLEASGLGELEVREDGWRVRLRRPTQGRIGGCAGAPEPQGASASASRPSSRSDRPAASHADITRRARARARVAITSPAWATSCRVTG
jgi:hypothetical protein